MVVCLFVFQLLLFSRLLWVPPVPAENRGAAIPQSRREPSASLRVLRDLRGRAGGRAMPASPRRLTGCLGSQFLRLQPTAACRGMETRGAGCRGAALRPPPRAGRCAGRGRGGAAPLAGWAAPRRGEPRAGPRRGGRLGCGRWAPEPSGGRRELRPQRGKPSPRLSLGPEVWGKFVSPTWADPALLKHSDVQLSALCSHTGTHAVQCITPKLDETLDFLFFS